MPVYNREAMVRHAIQSILDQTFQDWELVVIDDGSTDGTAEIVKGFRDKRIRYYKNPKNKGISFSRNKGNGLAKGEIIVVQDSDDMSFPDRLEEIWKHFQTYTDTQVLYHSFYIRAIDIKSGMRAVHREIIKPGSYDRNKAIQVPYIPGQLAYRRKIALKYREEMRFWDDWMFIVDCTMKKYVFTFLDRPLYEYVISEDSVTTQSMNTDLRIQEARKMKDILIKEYKLNVSINTQ